MTTVENPFLSTNPTMTEPDAGKELSLTYLLCGVSGRLGPNQHHINVNLIDSKSRGIPTYLFFRHGFIQIPPEHGPGYRLPLGGQFRGILKISITHQVTYFSLSGTTQLISLLI